MMGSVADAEDMLQETFIRWQKSPEEDIRSPKAFLVTIISRLCINHLQSARNQREEYIGQWLPEPLLTGPESDPSEASRLGESLSMAFLVLLERLTPVERAVFLLREVFDFEYAEISQAIDQNEASCRQILRRAKQHVAGARPRFDASPQHHEQLLPQFLGATSNGDLNGLVALLSNDVVFHSDGGGKATAIPNLVYGAYNVARVVLGSLKNRVPQNLVMRVAQVMLTAARFRCSRWKSRDTSVREYLYRDQSRETHPAPTVSRRASLDLLQNQARHKTPASPVSIVNSPAKGLKRLKRCVGTNPSQESKRQ